VLRLLAERHDAVLAALAAADVDQAGDSRLD
jgi:hypothetical protein